jgi:hypothetical protein
MEVRTVMMELMKHYPSKMGGDAVGLHICGRGDESLAIKSKPRK